MSSRFYTTEKLGDSRGLTPEGFLVVQNAVLARTGPQLYSEKEVPITGDSAGRVIINRDPEEVFRPNTLQSLNGKPIAIDHPDEDITPENYKDHFVGVVMYPRQGEGIKDNLLLGDLVFYDPKAIDAINNNRIRELSVGYDADYVEDGKGKGHQANIIANHLALVQEGRCGPVCRIGDSATIRFTDGKIQSLLDLSVRDCSCMTKTSRDNQVNPSRKRKRTHFHLHY